jgi:acetyl esterase/lipase
MRQGTAAGVRWVNLAIGIGALWIAVWIYLPAPTYFLLTFGVGAPEISHWLILASLVGIGLSTLSPRGVRRSRVARAGFVTSALTLLLSLGVWVRVPGAIQRFDDATRDVSAAPPLALRSRPIVVRDLFRRIDVGEAKVTRNIVFARPNGIPLRADVYQPLRAGGYPVVVQIYGGAWQRGQPSDKSNFATWLAHSGYVVIAIDYRHAPAWKWPAQIDDVNEAYGGSARTRTSMTATRRAFC